MDWYVTHVGGCAIVLIVAMVVLIAAEGGDDDVGTDDPGDLPG